MTKNEVMLSGTGNRTQGLTAQLDRAEAQLLRLRASNVGHYTIPDVVIGGIAVEL